MDKLKMQSENLIDKNIEKLAQLFPNCMTERITGHDGVGNPIIEKAVDFDLLRQELSSVLVEGKDERYRLDWSGKRQAILTANSPIAKTLRPVREDETTPTGLDSNNQPYKSTGSVGKDGTKGGFDSENLYIEGDNLDVLKLLHETYLAKVKMIYIDPPYNTGNDFVYNDDFAEDADEYLRSSNQKDEQGNRMVTNKDTSGRYHSRWLSMMYMRLKIARDLLTDDGVIFISIDDNEQANLKKICDEVFGASNFVSTMPRITKKSGKQHSENIAKNNDYIFIYTKNIVDALFYGQESNGDGFDFEDEFVETRGKYKLNQTLDYDSLWYNPTMDFPIIVDGVVYYAGGDKTKHDGRHSGRHNPKDWVWRWSQALFDFGYANGFVVIKQGKDRPRIYTKTYLNAKIIKNGKGNYTIETYSRENNISSLELVQNHYSNDNAKKELNCLIDANLFDFPKPTSLVKALIKLIDQKDMVVMDFFSGSATTAHAVMELNAEDCGKRKFICVQIPESIENDEYKNICEIGKERIRRAGKKVRETLWRDNTSKNENTQTYSKRYNLDIGFRVLKLDDSNMKDVYYNPSEYLDKERSFLSDLEKSIKEDRTAEDVLFQIMLDKGVLLSSQIELRKAASGNQSYYVVGKTDYDIIDLICCLDDNIDTEAVKEIAKLKPECCVFLDSSMQDDSTRTNIEQIFDTYSPTTKVEVI